MEELITTPIEIAIQKHILKETRESFALKVEEIVYMQDCSYMDAIMQVMNDVGYEPENVPKILTPELKTKLEIELEKVHLIKKQEDRLNI